MEHMASLSVTLLWIHIISGYVSIKKTGGNAAPIIKKGYTNADRVKSIREKNLAACSSPSGSSSIEMSKQLNCKLFLKLGKVGGARFTPDGKRRWRAQLVEPVDLHSRGWHEEQVIVFLSIIRGFSIQCFLIEWLT